MMLSLIASTALAQTRDRDPLTDAEVDQMREAADFPDKRLTLMIRFAKERIAMIGMLRSDPPSATRPKQIHDYLQDFIAILDETDDNIDMYGSHHSDMRKGLKLLIEADSEWQLKLRQLKEQSPTGRIAAVFLCAGQCDRYRSGQRQDRARDLGRTEQTGGGKETEQGLLRAQGLVPCARWS